MANRLIHTATHTSMAGSVHKAKVYRNSEYNEWIVKFSADGVALRKADYHASNKADAVDTADYHIQRISKQFA